MHPKNSKKSVKLISRGDQQFSFDFYVKLEAIFIEGCLEKGECYPLCCERQKFISTFKYNSFSNFLVNTKCMTRGKEG